MITFQELGNISPIFLTVLLIVALLLVELGNSRLKKLLLPFVIVLLGVFVIVAVLNVISML